MIAGRILRGVPSTISPRVPSEAGIDCAVIETAKLDSAASPLWTCALKTHTKKRYSTALRLTLADSMAFSLTIHRLQEIRLGYCHF
jgi:hypothetical protein